MQLVKANGFSEKSIWKSVHGEWKPLYGNYRDVGVSMEWHEFTIDKPLDWSATFHPNALELCINLEGEARIGPEKTLLKAGEIALYAGGDELQAKRVGKQKHAFLTIEMSTAWLRKTLGEGQENIRSTLLDFVIRKYRGRLFRHAPLHPEVEQVVQRIRHPRVTGSGHYLWMRARMLELLAYELFDAESEELFCTRHQLIARERVAQVQALLAEDLENPPSLKTLGERIGCSPFYLSRIFSKETGMTISRYLRTLRLERAAELLRTGRYNVTEAAMAVGYSSLSHFSKAFTTHYGRCPCAYPLTQK
ncbi:MAG: helix-turn-helix domain-containing protein [Chthoniobacterales bacterium]